MKFISGDFMNNVILVTGGARSGKSIFAERLADKLNNDVNIKKAYIATAQVFDNEMKQRVKLHKSRRGEDWKTFEAPFNAEAAIIEADKTSNVILFDCLTIYLSNFICSFEDLDDLDGLYSELKNLVRNLIFAAMKISSTIIFVTNEVGDGIVPENKLARIYRDCAGITNQMIASVANEVYLVVAGIPVNIKNIQYDI